MCPPPAVASGKADGDVPGIATSSNIFDTHPCAFDAAPSGSIAGVRAKRPRGIRPTSPSRAVAVTSYFRRKHLTKGQCVGDAVDGAAMPLHLPTRGQTLLRKVSAPGVPGPAKVATPLRQLWIQYIGRQSLDAGLLALSSRHSSSVFNEDW